MDNKNKFKNLKAWPFVEAIKILKKLENSEPIPNY